MRISGQKEERRFTWIIGSQSVSTWVGKGWDRDSDLDEDVRVVVLVCRFTCLTHVVVGAVEALVDSTEVNRRRNGWGWL